MSMRIPKDVEQLMWLIAESGDSNAAQEFERRFPDYRFELMRRMSTVKSLKASKPHDSISVPTFALKQDRVRSAPPRAFMVGVFALGLGVFAFGSFAITKQLMPPPAKPAVSVEEPAPKVTLVTPKSQPVYSENPPGISFQPQGQANNGTNQGSRSLLPTDEQPTSPAQIQSQALYNQPRDLSIEGAPLRSVIEMIARASGLQVDIMPNANAGPSVDFDKVISVDFRQVSGIDMLRQLANDHHFTLSPQGEGSFLLIPSPTKSPIINPGE